jgi:cell division protease FtsH
MNFKNNAKSLGLWAIIGLFLVAIFNIYHGSFTQEKTILPLSEFITLVERHQIKEVTLKEQDLQAVQQNGQTVTTHIPRVYNPVPLLIQHNVTFKSLPPDTSSFTIFALLQLLFPFLFIAGWFFFFRQMQNGNGRAMGFGKSRAKLSDPQKYSTTFKDVQGVEEAKEELEEIVEFLQDPSRFRSVGGTIPKGVLLVGPPGTGKTLLAKAVAGEAGVPFFSISGSDFVEMFVGVGASRVRDLFTQARQHAPCIIFIDEIDAVGRHRGIGVGGGHDEREQTLNQLLVEMDGFDPKEEIIVIAATNRSDVLDPALLRPGRFDRRVFVGLPDLRGREAIINVYLSKIKTSDDVSPRDIARGTPGFSGADLANLVNEAALRAARFRRRKATSEDFESSRDKIMMGAERRSLIISDDEKKLTAYHEAGHAVIAHHSEHSDPIHKATIIPRGGALGMVVRLPEGDRVSMSKRRLMADLAVAMGGRIAEELIFGADCVTTGGASDFKFATQIAKSMVVDWGMSDILGPQSYRPSQEKGTFFTERENSEEVMILIDKEVRRIIDEAYHRGKHILTSHGHHLELLAQHLLEYETLTGDQIKTLLSEGYLIKETPSQPVAKKSKSPSRVRKTQNVLVTP